MVEAENIIPFPFIITDAHVSQTKKRITGTSDDFFRPLSIYLNFNGYDLQKRFNKHLHMLWQFVKIFNTHS